MRVRWVVTIALLLAVPSGIRAEALDVGRFLRLVECHSKDLKLAERDRELAGLQKKQAVSAALPALVMEGSYNRNLSEYYMYFDMSALSPEAGGTAKMPVKRDNEFAATLALQQTLFSESVRCGIKAAREYRNLTDLVFEAGRDGVLCGAKQLFYRALLMEKVWQVSIAAEANALANYRSMQLQYDNGQISRFQLLQAETRWRETVPATREAERNFRLSLNSLKNWAGLDAQEEIELVGTLEEVPDLPPDPDLETVLAARPDFNALLWERRLRETSVSAARGSFLPSLKATIAYTYSAESDEFALDDENKFWFAGVTMSWPLLTGGYRMAEVERAGVELSKTQVRIDQAREDIANELVNVSLRLQEAHDRIESAASVLRAAEAAFTIAETSSQSGLATQLELKDARLAYDQAHLNYYGAVFDYLVAYFEWERLTGNVRT